MRVLDFLLVVAVILVLLWLLGFFIFNLGTIIWVLLVIAVIIILYRLLNGSQNITSTKDVWQRQPEALPNFFVNKRNRV